MSSHEFAVIDRYFKSIANRHSDAVLLGPGDDCALLQVPAGTELCVSTDTLVEGVHFPTGATPHLIACRTMAANLSDLAAMGASPFGFVLALTMPGVDESWLEAFSLSLSDLIGQYDIPLVGGNLSRGSLSLTVTVMGTTPAGQAVRRTGARQDDDIYVTGCLGDAAAGLELLRRGVQDSYLVSRYSAPTPRLAAGRALVGIATAMIDISDGLMADAGHLCEASHLGALIDVDELPLSVPLIETVGIDSARRMALFSGDDYELCFTAAPASSAVIDDLAASLELPITRVGKMITGTEIQAVDGEGRPLRYSGAGYQHF